MNIENLETYWEIVNHTTVVINYLLEGWLFYRFVKPFFEFIPQLLLRSYPTLR